MKMSGKTRSFKNTIKQIENKWQEFLPDEPFLYYFLDERLENLYTEERRTARISLTFSILAILIASLGLFGLTLYTTEKKTREIGIRKVLGARVLNVITLIVKNISFLMLISTLLAWLASYKIMSNWLEDFPYRINLSLWIFIGAAMIAYIVALITVSMQAYRAAKANPADSLRYE